MKMTISKAIKKLSLDYGIYLSNETIRVWIRKGIIEERKQGNLYVVDFNKVVEVAALRY